MGKDSTLAEKIYRDLYRDITEHRLESGQALTLNMLQKRFDTSHTPIREALNRLISDGLVDYSTNRGMRVKELTEDEIRQIFELSAELEIIAVRLCNRSFSLAPLKSDLREIIEAERAAVATADYKAWYEPANTFHACFYKYCSNDFLREAASNVESKLDLLSPYYSTVNTYLDIFNRHEQICEAVEAEDFERAAEQVRAHFQFSYRNVLEGYRNRFNK